MRTKGAGGREGKERKILWEGKGGAGRVTFFSGGKITTRRDEGEGVL